MPDLIFKALLAYLLGSVSGSLVLGRLRGVDIRTSGSGNAGGTNALRSQGWWFALGVVIIDIVKGALAVGWLPTITVFGAPLGFVTVAVCGLAAVLGHNYPIYFGFRGGKGAATYIGTWLALLPMILVPVLLGFGLMLSLTGYVGLSTITAAIISVPAAYLLAPSQPFAVTMYAILAAGLIVFAHRSNIARLLAGTENQFEKARLAYWLKRSK